MEIHLGLGFFADPIKDQLSKQGFTLQDADKIQEAADAITHLYWMDILSDTQTKKCRDRLFKMICAKAKLGKE